MSYITTTDNKDVLKTIFSQIDMFKTINFEDFLTNLRKSNGVITGSKIVKLLTVRYREMYDSESDLDISVSNYEVFNEYLLSVGFNNITPKYFTNEYSIYKSIDDVMKKLDDKFDPIIKIVKYKMEEFEIDLIVCNNPINMVCNTFDLKCCSRCVDSDFIQYSNTGGLDGFTEFQSIVLSRMNSTDDDIAIKINNYVYINKIIKRIKKYPECKITDDQIAVLYSLAVKNKIQYQIDRKKYIINNSKNSIIRNNDAISKLTKRVFDVTCKINDMLISTSDVNEQETIKHPETKD